MSQPHRCPCHRGSLSGVHGYTQAIIHVDDALVSLTGESPDTWDHVYSWAEELATQLADS